MKLIFGEGHRKDCKCSTCQPGLLEHDPLCACGHRRSRHKKNNGECETLTTVGHDAGWCGCPNFREADSDEATGM
jgi:hypothetical protein